MTKPSPFLPNTRFFPKEEDTLQRELNLSYNDLANSINQKDIAIYTTQETSTGQRFFADTGSSKDRQTLRKCFTIPSIANGATNVTHGIQITPKTMFTRIYGTGNAASTQFIPLPYINVASPADSVQIKITATQLQLITTTGNYSQFSAIVVLEYIPS